MSALLALVVVALLVASTLAPLLSDEAAPVPEDPGTGLALEREQVLAGLREVDLDYDMGKLTEEDRDRLRGELEGRAVRVMADIDAQTGAPGTGA